MGHPGLLSTTFLAFSPSLVTLQIYATTLYLHIIKVVPPPQYDPNNQGFNLLNFSCDVLFVNINFLITSRKSPKHIQTSPEVSPFFGLQTPMYTPSIWRNLPISKVWSLTFLAKPQLPMFKFWLLRLASGAIHEEFVELDTGSLRYRNLVGKWFFVEDMLLFRGLWNFLGVI